MTKILLAGLGGFIGSVSRYALSGVVQRLCDRPYPYGTFAVNIIGCLLIGFLAGYGQDKAFFSPNVKTFILIGILGGFTTFSSFGYETFALLNDRQIVAAAVNITASVFIGLVAVFIGFKISNFI